MAKKAKVKALKKEVKARKSKVAGQLKKLKVVKKALKKATCTVRDNQKGWSLSRSPFLHPAI